MNPYAMPMIAPYLAQLQYGQAPENPYLRNLQIPQVNLRGQRMRMRGPEMEQPQQQLPQVPMPANYDPNERVKNAMGMEMKRGTMDMFSDLGAGIGQAFDNPFVQALSYADRSRRARMGGDPEAQQQQFENSLALREADREDAQASKIAWTKVTEYLGDGQEQDYLMDPNNPDNKKPFGKPRNVKVADLPADVLEYEYAKKQAGDSPFPSYTDWAKSMKAAGANKSTTIVDMGSKQGEKFNEAMGKGMGEMYSKAVERQLSAPGTMARYDRMDELIDLAPTGKVADMTLPARQLLNSIGIGDDTTIASQEEFRSLTAAAALDETAKLPGVASDRDTMLIMDGKPALGKSSMGNKIMIRYAKAALKRDMQTPQVMEQYIAQSPNQSLDAGWPSYYQKWTESNPLLSNEDREAIKKLQGARTASPEFTRTATNPKTGEKVGWDGTKWVPIK